MKQPVRRGVAWAEAANQGEGHETTHDASKIQGWGGGGGNVGLVESPLEGVGATWDMSKARWRGCEKERLCASAFNRTHHLSSIRMMLL